MCMSMLSQERTGSYRGRRLAEEGEGQVFMSDTVLATLMCSSRSVYSWDVLITKVPSVCWAHVQHFATTSADVSVAVQQRRELLLGQASRMSLGGCCG